MGNGAWDLVVLIGGIPINAGRAVEFILLLYFPEICRLIMLKQL